MQNGLTASIIYLDVIKPHGKLSKFCITVYSILLESCKKYFLNYFGCTFVTVDKGPHRGLLV